MAKFRIVKEIKTNALLEKEELFLIQKKIFFLFWINIRIFHAFIFRGRSVKIYKRMWAFQNEEIAIRMINHLIGFKQDYKGYVIIQLFTEKQLDKTVFVIDPLFGIFASKLEYSNYYGSLEEAKKTIDSKIVKKTTQIVKIIKK